MLKVRTENEGKSFEAFVKALVTDKEENIVALSIASKMSSGRAIFGTLYSFAHNTYLTFIDTDTNSTFIRRSTRSYKRIEDVYGKVYHGFFVPRMAIEKEFEEELQRAEQHDNPKPERYIFAKAEEFEKEVGMFLANTYGLPKTESWVTKYLSLLPSDKYEILSVQTTELMEPDWKDFKAIHIQSMLETDVLNYIEIGIKTGVLNPYSQNSLLQANFKEGMSTEQYLQENAVVLANNIEKYLKPQYDGTYFHRAIGLTKRVSLPAQARAVMGAYTVLKNQQSCFLVGALGSGKTQMALTLTKVLFEERIKSGAKDGLRVLIVAPSIIVPKWATSEIPSILGKANIKVNIINSTEDAIKYVQKVKNGYKTPKGTIEFVLVSTDRMKLGANKYVLGAKWDRHLETWRCPDCNKPLKSPEATKEEEDMVASWQDAVENPKEPPTVKDYKGKRKMPNGLPEGFVKKWSNKIRRFTCHNCSITETDYNGTEKVVQKNHSLVRPAVKNRGEDKVKPRWMIAQIFQKHLPNHFHLGIYDEAHQYKASNSGRGLSFHKLLKSTRKHLFLTATLTNGEAASVQSILWRSDAKSLLEEGFNHNTTEIAFAQKYGVVEKVTYRKDDGIVGVTTNRRKDKVILKTKPGISPRLTTKHLLHKSIFLDLEELGLPLVKKEEIPIIVPLKEEHKKAYHAFHFDLYNACQRAGREYGTGAWASFNPSTLMYADQPHIPQVYEYGNEYVESEIFDKDYITAKEEKLVEIVKENLAENRGCIIYNHFTGDYKQNERLQHILKQYGIDSEILNTNVSATKRFEWLEEQKQKGTKVLIMNMSLVQVGLDLLEWSSIIYYQLHDDINVLRQAGGRNWRIGQNRNCRIYYLINEGTQQQAQFERLMTRRIEALLVEGRISRNDPLVQFAQSNESKLARDLSFSLESTDLAEKWKSAAEKDIDQNLELVDESELKERITQAFATLTAETKTLCGVPLIEEKEVVQEMVQPEPIVEEVLQSNEEEFNLFTFEQFIVEKIGRKKKKPKGIEAFIINQQQEKEEVVEQFAFDFKF